MKTLALTCLILSFLVLTFAPAAVRAEDSEDLKVDVLKPFEKADPGKVGISEMKVRQMKKAEHVIVEGVKEPPRVDDRADLGDFKEPKIDVVKVKPFDPKNPFARDALPLAGKQELAGAIEFEDLDADLLKSPDLPEIGTSADAKIVENVFDFRHVTGNDKLGTPLFSQQFDPRIVTIQKGGSQLDAEGNFKADLQGVTVDNMFQPGFQIGAAVFCGDGREVHRTGLFPLDDAGNARIEETMMFPSDCAAPAVLFMGPEGMMIGAAGGAPVR